MSAYGRLLLQQRLGLRQRLAAELTVVHLGDLAFVRERVDDGAGHQREQHRHDRDQRRRTARLPLDAPVDELALAHRQELAEILGLAQPRAPVERQRIAVARLPQLDRGDELLVSPEVLAFLVDPPGEPGPAQHGVVGQLDAVLGERHQPGLREEVQQVRVDVQPAAAALRDPVALHGDEPQEDLPGRALVVLAEAREERLGGLRGDVLDAAGLLEARERQRHAALAPPRLDQCLLHQRQRVLVRRVGHQPGDDRGLDGGADLGGGFGDGAAQLVRAHRLDDDLGAADALLTPALLVVGAHGEHDVGAAGDGGDEVLRVECLLEVVDEQHEAGAVLADPQPEVLGVLPELLGQAVRGGVLEDVGEGGGQVLDRVLARRDHHGVVQRGVQTGQQQRRPA